MGKGELDMAKNENKFNDLFGNIKKDDNAALATHVVVKDIAVDQIDFDEKNEELNGYDDIELNALDSAMSTTKQQQVIGVYSKEDGRYQCYSGHRRILVAKRKGKKTVTCQISKLPENRDDQIETLMLMNVQRNNIRPLYLARQFKEEERILRARGYNGNISKEIGRLFGFSEAQVNRYRKIMKYPEEFQNLCKRSDFPFTAFNDSILKLDEKNTQKLLNLINQIIEKNGRITENELKILIHDIDKIEVKEQNNEKAEEKKQKGKEYKDVDSMLKSFQDTINRNINIADLKTIKTKDKNEIKEAAQNIIDVLNTVIEYCSEE